MIVISTSLVLDPVETGPDHPLIGWNNLVTASNIAADTALANYPASNLANPATHNTMEWRAADTTEQHLTVTTDGLTQVDYLAVAKHNFGSAQIPVSVEGFIGGVWAELASPVLLPDDSPVLFRFSPQALANGPRLRMQSGSAAGRAAVLYAGKLLIMEKRIYVGHTPFPQARRSVVTSGMSDSGNFLGNVELGSWRQPPPVHFQLISPAWYRANMDGFLKAVGKRLPFFFAWRPGTYPREVGYAWLTDDTLPTPDDYANGNLIAFDLAMSGIA